MLITDTPNKRMNKLKLLDLFSGIGGFSYGLESTNGFETIAFCEKDKFCQKVLRKHWNNIKIYEDVRNINGKEIKADIVTGGFPCQPFSVAGKRRGTDDDRYLWDETIRVIAEAKPKWFVGENVEGIVNIQEGKVLQQIQKDLEAENFQVQCLIIPASGIGAWHQRKRIWIIGYSDSNANAKKEQSSNGSENSFPKEHRSKDSSIQLTRGTTNNSLSNSIGFKLNGCSNASRVREAEQDRLDSNKERNRNEIRSEAERCSEQAISNSNGERQQKQLWSKSAKKEKSGFECESWWEAQSKLCGVPDGVSTQLHKDRANRIKALGNSIVPQIAREIGKAIMEAELGS